MITSKHFNQKGSTSIEYALLAAVICIAVAASVFAIGNELIDFFPSFSEQIAARESV